MQLTMRMSMKLTLFCLLVSSCGYVAVADTLQKRIVGGTPIELTRSPWSAFILFDANGDMGQCSSTIISNRWLLTAAHCFMRSKNNAHYSAFLGYHKVNIDDKEYTNGPWNSLPETAIHLKIESVVVHPQFDPETGKNDIALLKLATDLPSNVKTISVMNLPPASAEQLSANKVGELFSWGCVGYKTGFTGYPTHALFKVRTKQECLTAYPEVVDTCFCAGGEQSGVFICDGDSGGGLIFDNPSSPYVGGIVSAANDNADGTFTDVAQFIDWIKEVQGK